MAEDENSNPPLDLPSSLSSPMSPVSSTSSSTSSSSLLIQGPPACSNPPFVVLDWGKGVFLAGFRDCTSEALRYLTEVEQIQPTDPVIAGLAAHLVGRQHALKKTSQDEEEPRTEDDSDAQNGNILPPPHGNNPQKTSTPNKDKTDILSRASMVAPNACPLQAPLTADSTVIHQDKTTTDCSWLYSPVRLSSDCSQCSDTSVVGDDSKSRSFSSPDQLRLQHSGQAMDISTDASTQEEQEDEADSSGANESSEGEKQPNRTRPGLSLGNRSASDSSISSVMSSGSRPAAQLAMSQPRRTSSWIGTNFASGHEEEEPRADPQLVSSSSHADRDETSSSKRQTSSQIAPPAVELMDTDICRLHDVLKDDLFDSGIDLGLLAQNNPAIFSLTSQLLDLIDPDDDDDVDDGLLIGQQHYGDYDDNEVNRHNQDDFRDNIVIPTENEQL